MELIGKVSKGSKMDQVYLPKNRIGFHIGNYVVIRPLEKKKLGERLYFYGIESVEPVKLKIIKEAVSVVGDNIENCENVIVTGSFLDEGFQFNDIDVIIVAEDKLEVSRIKDNMEEKIGIKTHIITLDKKSLVHGLETDPLYQMMLSRCIAKKRFVYKIKHKINYKLLDLHLLKSKMLIDNFDVLSGNEKYGLVRNMIAIYLYILGKKVSIGTVNKEIKQTFGLSINEIKQNMIDKKSFLKKYKLIYNQAFAKVLRGIEHGAE